MRFFPKEPDIETICKRIDSGLVDLQPDFQRSEVWPVEKQQRLIDTILREWVVPPVLLIMGSDSRAHVLDGQQRLAAIRDFRRDAFPIDGRIEPYSAELMALHGKKYSALPPHVMHKFDGTALRTYEIVDYKPSEPAEIFFRLNQPTALTAAEKRNAFFGPVRDQIRSIAEKLKSEPNFIESIGFSNSRMAYDDVLARAAFFLDARTLRKKATDQAINAMYRSGVPLSEDTEDVLQFAAGATARAVIYAQQNTKIQRPLKFNKATLLTWILFFARLKHDDLHASDFLTRFELLRQGYFPEPAVLGNPENALYQLLPVFSDRATSRVGDVTSILLRDFIVWVHWVQFSSSRFGSITRDPNFSLQDYRNHLRAAVEVKEIQAESYETATIDYIEKSAWGHKI